VTGAAPLQSVRVDAKEGQALDILKDEVGISGARL
jgi:hypothetical protein